MQNATHAASRKSTLFPEPPSIAADQTTPLDTILGHLLGIPVLCYATLAFWVFLLVPRPIQDPDIWWHLRNAAQQWHSHRFLHQDPYSFTAAGAAWINHEWLAELPFYLGWQLAGPDGLYAVTLLTLQFIFLTLFWLTLKKSGSLSATLFTTVIASFLSTVSFGPRTLLFGWAFLMIELLILNAIPHHPRVALLLPLLFTLWINTHGSWLIGFILLAIYIVTSMWTVELGAIQATALPSRHRRTLILALLFTIAALFINPYGWHLVAYPFDLAFHQPLNIASVEEWQPLNFHSARGLGLLLSLGFLFFSQLLIPSHQERRTWHPSELAFLALGTYAAVIHARFLFLAALLILPLVARELARVRLPSSFNLGTSTRKASRLVPAALLLFLLLSTGRIAMANRASAPVNEDQFPRAALPYLQAFHPHGRVFNAFIWGGYLDYYAPQIPVFIDSRVDIFERKGVLRDYLDIVRLRNSLALLDTYQVRYVLFERDTPLVYLLQQTRSWKADYDDGKVILLERIELTAPQSSKAPAS